ncbi:histidine kinase [Paenibacillus harenae]|uniref:histidine kinase n=1 Tax=Paenibacillus harenae TaxID=306543 RepID=A0ABT9U230_PAEHA|nr:sensor histidine kinase [Paenibacillus harenae]MDQ0062902.1 two-component system sensor histidine kinase YesM [Paenibacillus harenae]MDQ0112514.1 two-component system sensor histidine kinase YesM [Paenibacillus harenae]
MRNAIRFPKQLSVKAKFVITFLSSLTASMGFMGFILYDQASQAAIDQGKILMMQDVQQMKDSLSQKVTMVQSLSELIASSPSIQNFLGSPFLSQPYQSQEYRDNIAPIIGSMFLQNKYLHSIRIYVKNQSLPELYDGFYHLSRIEAEPSYAPFIQDMHRITRWRGLHNEHVLLPSPGSIRHTQVFSYDHKILSSRYTDMAGILEIEVDRDDFFASLKASKDHYRGNVFVVDASGRVVSGSSGLTDLTDYGLQGLPGDVKFDQVMDVKGVRSIVISAPLDWLDLRIVGIYPVSPFIDGMKHSWSRMFFVLLAVLLALCLIVYGITSRLLRRMKVLVRAMREVREGSLDVSVPVESNDEFTLMAQSFNTMTRRIHDLVETVYKSRIVEKEAELRALESQINPHFLYNTLATISWVARKVQSPEITNIANAMAKFYRLVLNKGKSTILVYDEIEMVRVYAQIQKFRFENMFDIVFDVDDKVYPYTIPKNILQPLVENALSHGIEPKRSHGTIIVRAYQTTNHLVFQVIDDGVGIPRERVQAMLSGQIRRSSGSGYAFKNILDRLRGYYGDEVKVAVVSRPGVGTSINITLPKE